MRAIFLIPNSEPPTLKEPHKWSADFHDFLRVCLQKNPDKRPSASELLQVHPFLTRAKGKHVIAALVDQCLPEIEEYREQEALEEQRAEDDDEGDNDYDTGTMQVNGTMVSRPNNSSTMLSSSSTQYGTLIAKKSQQIQQQQQSQQQQQADDSDENSDDEGGDFGTMVVGKAAAPSNAPAREEPDFMKMIRKQQEQQQQPQQQPQQPVAPPTVAPSYSTGTLVVKPSVKTPAPVATSSATTAAVAVAPVPVVAAVPLADDRKMNSTPRGQFQDLYRGSKVNFYFFLFANHNIPV